MPNLYSFDRNEKRNTIKHLKSTRNNSSSSMEVIIAVPTMTPGTRVVKTGTGSGKGSKNLLLWITRPNISTRTNIPPLR